MARPSEQEVRDALGVLTRLVVRDGMQPVESAALGIVREASERLLPAKEAAEILGVEVGNMKPGDVRGLPEPEVEWPRPTKNNPDRVVRWWSERKIRECAAGRRPRREREDKG